MPRLERFVRRASLLAVFGFAGAAFTTPFVGPTRPALIAPTIGSIAAQLGVRVESSRADEEFTVGVQFSGSLEEPLKLSTFGVTGFAVGARVTVARIAPDRVHIEADEMLPVEHTEKVRVRIDADGRLLKPAKT
jgi:hypothetical protein